MRKCIISWMYSNFGQIGRLSTELAALEHKKPTVGYIMGKMGSTVFLGYFSAVDDIDF